MIRAFLVLVFLATSAAAEGFLTDNRGEWAGMGDQSGDTWAVELQIVPGGARVDYPDIPCGGVWVISDESAVRAEGVEWLSYGHALCLDGLLVTLTQLPENAILVRWLEQDGTEVAFAELTRPPGEAKSGGKKE